MSRRGSLAEAVGRAPRSSVELTPVRLPEGVLVLRSPRLSDAPAWSAARLANREWLERAFPAWGGDWASEQTEVAWAQRWARLRRDGRVGRSKSFVMTLDDELIGEMGIDAVDEVSGAGEASVWMVRSHGSPAVMTAASWLMIEHAFTGPHPIDRMLSPVAISSRRGRAPGLTAVGFEIEATVPRRVGSTGLVDHDIWVLHNTADNRRRTTDALRALRAEAPGDGGRDRHSGLGSPAPSRAALSVTAARAAVREARGGVRRMRSTVAARRPGAVRPLTVPGSDRPMTMRPATGRDLDLTVGTPMPRGAIRWAVESDGQVAAVVGHSDDHGTATTEVFVRVRPGVDRDLLVAALGTVLDDVRPAVDEPRVLVVRVPAGTAADTMPDPALLTGLGLERIATYRAHPGTAHRWGGEDVWRAPARG